MHIYIYRGSELYFMLAEALNNLGRVTEASALINQGVNGSFPNGGVTWDGFTDDWTGASTLGTRRYPDLGIRGAFNLGNREFTRGDARANDEAILDEMMLEFPAEGKIYAPADGEIGMVFDTLHAVSLVSEEGTEILIHVGLDTVKMNGEGFTGHVKAGDKVKKGDLLLEVDLDKVKAAGYDTITPMLVCNTMDYASVEGVTGKEVEAGDDAVIIEK